MSSADADRIAALESEIARVSERISRLEERRSRHTRYAPTARESAVAASAPQKPKAPSHGVLAPALPTPGPPRERPPVNLEEILGGRLLALVGGVAVIVGLAFFVVLAVDRGWVGESMRTALAFAGSGLLLAAGIWIAESRGRTQAALAVVGTGLAGLYLSLTAATALYHLVPIGLAFPVAFAVGTLATALALRWNSRTVAGLGILGALGSPVLMQSVTDAAAVVFLPVGLASAVAVLIWRRWEWLRIGAFAIVMPQIAFWSLSSASAAAALVVLAAFAALNLAAAVGYELRVPPARLRPSTSLLVAANALVIAGTGYLALGDARAGGLWVAGLAAAHLILGVGSLKSGRTSREIGFVLLGVALTSADVAFGLLVDGPALAVGWAASAAGLAVLARRYAPDRDLVRVTLGGQLSLAIGHALLFEAHPSGLADGSGDVGAAASAVGAIAAGAFACARATRSEGETWRKTLDLVSMAALAYVTAFVLDGVQLVLAWSFEAAALAQVAHRTRDRFAGRGALGFLVLAVLHALAFEGPPRALVYGVGDLLAAALALGAVAAVSVRCARLRASGLEREAGVLAGLAGAALLHLSSIAVVSGFQPGAESLGTGLGLDVRQQGQAVLSAFWSACGLGALWIGLRRTRRELRLAGFALLSLAVAKVFLYDLSVLESAYRVLSFIVLGLLLLMAALAYQRMERGGRLRSS